MEKTVRTNGSNCSTGSLEELGPPRQDQGTGVSAADAMWAFTTVVTQTTATVRTADD
jgi:hypothetical protein